MSLHHKLCHTLGGTFNLPHAETHTVVLPYALAYNSAHALQAIAALQRATGAQEPASLLSPAEPGPRSASVPARTRADRHPTSKRSSKWPPATPTPTRARSPATASAPSSRPRSTAKPSNNRSESCLDGTGQAGGSSDLASRAARKGPACHLAPKPRLALTRAQEPDKQFISRGCRLQPPGDGT